jgi:HEAT repeat protein
MQAILLSKDINAIKNLVNKLKKKGNSRETYREIVKYGKLATTPLIELLENKDFIYTHGVIVALGEIGDPLAVEPLIKKLKEGDTWPAARSLAEIGDKRAIYPLILALDNNINNSVYRALISFGAPAREAIISSLSNMESSDVRRNSLRFLRENNLITSLNLVVPLLSDQASDVRVEAIRALIGFDGEIINELLLPLLRDKNDEVRFTAADALYDRGDKRAFHTLVGVLISSLNSEEFGERRKEYIAIDLGNIGDKRATMPLIGALKGDYSGLRERAAEALGKIGDKRAIEPLVDNLVDWYSGEAVASALKKLEWSPRSEEERIHFAVAKRDRIDLRVNWNLARKVLLSDIDSTDYRIIENALFAFIGIGKSEIVSELVQNLKTKGNKTMAEAYLNCGHKELYKAARDWAAMHGYVILKGSGEAPVGWGSM